MSGSALAAGVGLVTKRQRGMLCSEHRQLDPSLTFRVVKNPVDQHVAGVSCNGFQIEAERREPSGFRTDFKHQHRTARAVPQKVTDTGG